jgi:hypothetical protein
LLQGYIIFPAIIGIIQRLANSVTVTEDGTITIDFQLKGIETAQVGGRNQGCQMVYFSYQKSPKVRTLDW